jgi:uncharacterized membrane protein required for colicin V production
MEWIDWVGLVLAGILIGIGAMRGFVAGALGMLALLAGYGVGYLAATSASDAVGLALGLDPLVSMAVAGTAGFLLTYLILSGIFTLWLRSRRKRHKRISASDRFGGALLGAAQGALVALVFYWLVGQATASGLIGTSREPSELMRASQKVVTSGAQAVLGGPDGNPLAARMLADPVGTANELQAVLETPSMSELQGDALFWQYVSSGAIDSALNQASFMRAARDAELRKRIVDLGAMPPEALDDPEAFRAASRDALEQVAPRLQAIRDDPALIALRDDPEVRRALEAGDVLSLASHPGVRELVRRALATGPEVPASAE